MYLTRWLCILVAFIGGYLPTVEHQYIQIDEFLAASWIEYDLGEVHIGQKTECDLLLKNVSSNSIQISCLAPGCHCISLAADKMRIRPSKTSRVHIVYDSTNHQKGYEEQSVILCIKNHKNPFCFVLKAELQ